MKEHERKEFERVATRVIVTIGGILTLAYALYFIFDTIKKWY